MGKQDLGAIIYDTLLQENLVTEWLGSEDRQ
jgi:hypothetical protein